jgi:hypothetical protein
MPAKTYGVFYDHAQPQADGTFKDVVMVELFITGNSNTSTSKCVYDENGELVRFESNDERNGKTYPELYPKAWAKYSKDVEYTEAGVDLSNLQIGPSAIKNLQAEGIDTVEDLAELSDSVVLGVPGRLDLRKKAQAYMAALRPEKAAAEREAAEREKADLLDRIRKLEDQINQPKKRGRPKEAANVPA